MSGPLVLKLGGELIESAADRARIADAAAAVTAGRPLVIVHGGGRSVDAELDRKGIVPRKVDGLRITDPATLDVVVAVLAGTANTELVSALVARSVPAVGLTGVDAGLGKAVRVGAHRAASGAVVDLGLVGDPSSVDATLVELLLVHGYVPVIASVGIESGGGAAILNVNADVMACRIAAALSGSDLVIAGGTPGVLDAEGESIPFLDAAGIEAAISSGTATAGMVAKLSACRTALEAGVASVRIVDGRALDPGAGMDDVPGTTLTLHAASSGAGESRRAGAGVHHTEATGARR